MKKCIIMSRVSTTLQELDIQEEECIQLALYDGYEKENMILVPREGESARKIGEIITVDTPRGPMEVELDRDGIWAMKKHIESDSDVDCVYVWEVSRLARRIDVLTALLKYFAHRKIQLRVKVNGLSYLDEGLNVNPAVESMIIMLGQQAEQEMNIKIARFKRTKKANAERGKYSGGKVPYGYFIDKEHGSVYAIKEDEAAIVREIYNLYEAGITQPKIAREFMRRGITEINLSKVNNILTNVQYTGRWFKQGWSSYERSYPVIITPEQYDHCRDIAASNNTFAGKTNNIYYAHKLIVCRCGRIWGAGPSKVCYRCLEAHKTGNAYEIHMKQCDNKSSISINVLDSLLWYIAIDEEVNYILHSAAKNKQDYEDRILAIKQKLKYSEIRLSEQDKKKKRAAESYIDGIIDKESRNIKFKEVETEIRAILLEQATYAKEIEHLESMISASDRLCVYANVSDIATELEKIIALKESISSVTEDQVRYDIIHRHVKSVHIENRTIEYTFTYRGTKQTPARYIIVDLYSGAILRFYYLSFAGGKNIIIAANDDASPREKVEVEYLGRFFDEGKRIRRQKSRISRIEKIDQSFPKEKFIFSYTGLASFLGIKKKMAYSLVQNHGLEAAKVNVNGRSVAFNKEIVLSILRERAAKIPKIKMIYDAIPEDYK